MTVLRVKLRQRGRTTDFRRSRGESKLNASFKVQESLRPVQVYFQGRRVSRARDARISKVSGTHTIVEMLGLGDLANISGLAVVEVRQNGAESRGLKLASTLLHLIVNAPPIYNIANQDIYAGVRTIRSMYKRVKEKLV